MIANWGIEAKKWQILVRPVEKLNIFRAFRAVLSGLSLSLFLPNGIGEYTGRIVYMSEGNRLRSVALTIVGSIAQVLVTFIAGIAGLIYLRHFTWTHTTQFEGLTLFWMDGIMYFIIIGTLLLLLIYFKLSWLTKIIDKIPYIYKYKYLIESIENFHPKELTKILLLSVVRFCVFVLQYLLLLHIFQVEVYWLDAVFTTCVLFLVLAILPTIPLADVGLRGEAGLQLFGIISANSLGIVATATGIWLVNLIIPSIFGSIFMLGVRIFRNK
ncbi:MAG: flippase-like domain-containing protein [Bacteroidetes bacterium]|nr:flippase-like domain-containing protein [Bacteroidota bacterium]